MEIGRHRGMIPNALIKIGSNSYEKVKTFKYLGATKQKRRNMAHLLLNRRNDEQRMDKSRIRLV